MPPAALSRAPDLARLPIAVNPRAISLSEALRAGLSVSAIIALGEYLAIPALREAALARAALTTIGGLIAVSANFLLWPSREPELVAAEVRRAIAAHGRYAEAGFSRLLGETTPAALGQARRAAGVSTNSLEALMSRALLEPGNSKNDPLEAALLVDAALRRCPAGSARCKTIHC